MQRCRRAPTGMVGPSPGHPATLPSYHLIPTADALKSAESFPDGCIIFLDELDALATSRGGDMHEATRRILGVLLRHLDGFDANKKTGEGAGRGGGAVKQHASRSAESWFICCNPVHTHIHMHITPPHPVKKKEAEISSLPPKADNLFARSCHWCHQSQAGSGRSTH
jgi:hypothetical protein